MPANSPSGDLRSPLKPAPWQTLPVLVVLALAAFAVRLACLFEITRNDLFGSFVLDSDYFRRCAEHLSAGDWFFADLVYSCPLYPLFLAIGSSLFEGRFFPVRILQAGIDVATGFLIYGLALRLFGRRPAAIVAAALYFFYGAAILYSGLLLDTSLVTFLYTAFLAALLKAHDTGRSGDWAFSGFVAGLCLLIKANLLFFLPFLMLWIFQARGKEWRRAAQKAFIFLAALLFTLLPFAVKNQRAAGYFSPFPPHGGLNFYIGNNPAAKGYYMSLPGIADQYPRQFTDSVKMAERLTGRPLTPQESSAVWFRAGFRSIARDPRAYADLAKKKILIFWNKLRIPSNINFYFYQRFVSILRWPWVSFGWLVPTAFLGLVLAWISRKDEWRLAAYFSTAYFLSVVSLFVTARYRFPFVPTLILLACYGAMRLGASIRDKRWIRAAVMAAIVVLGGWLAHRDIPEGDFFRRRFENDYNNLGIHLEELGKREKSIQAYRAAIAANPQFADPYYNIGLLFAEAEQWSRAVRYFRKAVKLWPGMWYAHYQLGVAYERMGQIDEAIAEYRLTLELSPDFSDTQNRLALLYLRGGDIAAAMASFTESSPAAPAAPVRVKRKPKPDDVRRGEVG